MNRQVDGNGSKPIGSDTVTAGAIKPLTTVEKISIMTLMPLLFRSVFGWREVDQADRNETDRTAIDPSGAHAATTQFDVIGIDGSILNCMQFSAKQSPAKGVVLLCHPFLKYGMAYFFKHQYPAWLNAAGYHVIAFNFKGFGGSTIGGIAFADDVQSLAHWIDTTHPALPVHLLGASFGGYHGIHGIARHRLQFASAIFDSVPADITGFFGRGLGGLVMRWLSRSRWAQPTGTAPLVGSYSALQHPACLFLYGSDDRFMTPPALAELRRHCPAATIVNYPQCTHLDLRKKYKQRYMNDITDFLDSHARRPQHTALSLDAEKEKTQ